MRTATTVEASRPGALALAVEAEHVGLDVCWVAEAWGADALTALGWLAGRTERMLLGAGVVQIGTRTPVAIAQAAATLTELSGGRFLLGLGPSGPGVIEGLHGVAFERPLTRTREAVEVIRLALSGERVAYSGETVTIPRPGGEGRPLRLATTPCPDLPIYLATMSPRMLELTGRIADGWLGTSFVPEGAAAYFDPLDVGLAAAGRTRADLDVCQGAEVAFATDEDALAPMVADRKRGLAFSLGGMGSPSTNFYHAAYSRQGWTDVAAAVRERWQAGDKVAAAALVTDEMVLATTLIGTQEMVATRLRVWRDVGVDTVRLYPAGETLDEQVTTLARAIELVHEVSAAGP